MSKAEYYGDVQGLVDCVRHEIEAGRVTNMEDVFEFVRESVDGHHRIIYTAEAREVLVYSDNRDAYAEHFGSEGMTDKNGIRWEALAFCAMEADVLAALPDEDELFATPDEDYDRDREESAREEPAGA